MRHCEAPMMEIKWRQISGCLERIPMYHPQIGLVFADRSSPFFFFQLVQIRSPLRFIISIGFSRPRSSSHQRRPLQFRSTSSSSDLPPPSVKPALLFPIGIVHSRRPQEASIFSDQIRRQANRLRLFPSSYHSRDSFLSTLVTVCYYYIYFSVIDRWTDRCSQWLRLTHAETVQ